MILDKNGKLFGKISLVDLGIIVLIVLAAVVVVSKFSQPIRSGSEQGDKIQYTVTVKKIRDASFSAVAEGDNLYDKETGAYVGKVVSKDKQPALDMVQKTDGTYTEAEVPQRYDMTLTLEATGRKTEGGFYMDGKKELLKNADINFTNENIAFSGTVQSIGQ